MISVIINKFEMSRSWSPSLKPLEETTTLLLCRTTRYHAKSGPCRRYFQFQISINSSDQQTRKTHTWQSRHGTANGHADTAYLLLTVRSVGKSCFHGGSRSITRSGSLVRPFYLCEQTMSLSTLKRTRRDRSYNKVSLIRLFVANEAL